MRASLKHGLLSATLLLGLIDATSAAHAQDSSITVTGKTQPPAKTAQRFIRQVLDTDDGQLARFTDPVCLQVLGLPPKLSGTFEGRFREDVRDAGARLARGKCDPNLMILFVANSDGFMKMMRKYHSTFFADLPDAERRKALEPGAIRGWRQLAMRDDMGNISGFESDPDSPPVFEDPVRTVTINAVLVLDKQVAPGNSIGQLADYAAMRTLAGATPPKKGSITADSILSLFDPNATPHPTGLTDMDRKLLSGLYAMRDDVAEQDGRSQVYAISRGMAASPKPARPAKR